MAEKSWMFNSVNGDRPYNAEDIGAFLAPFFSGGIFANPSSNLQVTADGSGMTVTVQPGYALLKGNDGKLHMYRVDTALALPISTADGANNRIDRIVVRLDTANRMVSAQIKQGTYATSPTAPAVEQDADYWELALADVSVPAGTSAISQAAVTDQRLNTAVCGVVAATVQQLDTSTLFTQYQSWLTTQIAAHASDNTNWQTQMQADLTAFQTSFNAWFDTIKGQLGSDAAGSLQNQINTHEANDTLHTPYAVATNSGNAYSVTLNPAPTAYTDGLALCVKINAASTGAATLNVNGLGAIPIYDAFGNAVTNLKANTPYSLRYEATSGHFFVLGKGGGGNATAAQILSGQTATVDSGPITGTMPNKTGSGTIIVPGTSDIVIPQGYFGGAAADGKIKGDAGLIGANFAAGLKLFQGTAGEIDGTAAISHYANGNKAADTSYTNFHSVDLNGGVSAYAVTVTNLAFTPSIIILVDNNTGGMTVYSSLFLLGMYANSRIMVNKDSASTHYYDLSTGAVVSSTGFTLPTAANAGDSISWYAKA